jgi:hypothetical protein
MKINSMSNQYNACKNKSLDQILNFSGMWKLFTKMSKILAAAFAHAEWANVNNGTSISQDSFLCESNIQSLGPSPRAWSQHYFIKFTNALKSDIISNLHNQNIFVCSKHLSSTGGNSFSNIRNSSISKSCLQYIWYYCHI